MSTRPSHDNVINALGVNMSAALDQIMTVQEQSYDEFLDEFTYLNKDELKRDMINPPKKKIETPKVDRSVKTAEKTQHYGHIMSTTENSNADKAKTEDELEEEILGEGEKTSIMSQKSATGTDITSKLKFDNFVINDDADDDDDQCDENGDEFILDGYEASFYTDLKTGSSDKTSKGRTKEVETKDEDEADIDFLLQDNSENSKLEISVHFENRDFQVKCAEQEEIPSNQTVSIIDSDSSDPQKECDSCSEQLSYTDKVGLPPSDSSLNPGEVEDPGSPSLIDTKDKEQILDFTATYRTEVVSTSDITEECSDEVTAFSLDEDFDYDNVILTPKFTVEEVAFLRSCRT